VSGHLVVRGETSVSGSWQVQEGGAVHLAGAVTLKGTLDHQGGLVLGGRGAARRCTAYGRRGRSRAWPARERTTCSGNWSAPVCVLRVTMVGALPVVVVLRGLPVLSSVLRTVVPLRAVVESEPLQIMYELRSARRPSKKMMMQQKEAVAG
jgi:hypothetical protein